MIDTPNTLIQTQKKEEEKREWKRGGTILIKTIDNTME